MPELTDDYSSEVYISRGGEVQIGDPIGLDDYLIKGNQRGDILRVLEILRGSRAKLTRDSEELQRRETPPAVPRAPLKPDKTVSSPAPAESPPKAEDLPALQGAPDLATLPDEVVVLNQSQSSPPLVSSQAPSYTHYQQLAPLDAQEVASLISPLPADFEAAVRRILKNEPEPGEPHPTHAAPVARRPAADADPVDLFTGAFTIGVPDLVVPTPYLPIAMSRSYRSGHPYYGPFGFGWDHAYNVYLRQLNDGGFALWTGQLLEQHFGSTGGGWEPNPGIAARLERIPGLADVYAVKFPGGRSWLFERPTAWSDTHRIPLTAISDRHGNVVRLSYNALDRVASVLDAAGRGLLFHYGNCGLLESVSDHTRSRVVRYEHDNEIEHLIRVVLPATGQYPNCLSTTYEYDSYATHPAMQHNILRIHDAEDRMILENEFAGPDAGWEFNSVVRQRMAGFEYQFGYEQIQYVEPDTANVDTLATRTLVRPPDGSLHTYTFNYRGDLLDHRFRLNRDRSFRVVASRWEHDAEGNVTEAVGPDGLRTIFTFDSTNSDPCARRNLLRVELASPFSGIVASRVLFEARYDPLYQLPIQAKDEVGAETKFVYDFDVSPFGTSGRLLHVHLPAVVRVDGAPQQSVLTFEHNAQGQLTAAISAEGGRTELGYFFGGIRDSFLSTIKIDPTDANLVSKFEYDSAGFPKTLEAPGARTTGFMYNALGQVEEVLAPVIGGQNAHLRRWFDDSGSVVRVERPAGSYSGILQGTSIVDEYERDEVGNVRRVTLASNTTDRREWRQCVDHNGRADSTWDPLGTRMERVFSENGSLLSETAASGESEAQKTSYFHDRAGRVTRIVDPWKSETGIEYDVWGRPQNITLPTGAVRTLEWGANDRLLEERVEENVSGTVLLSQRQSYQYDRRGRLVVATASSFRDNPAAAVPISTRYLYDKADHLRELLLPRGTRYSFEFDAIGRPSKETDPHGNVRKFDYDASGDLTELTMIDVAAGVTRTRTGGFAYDARGRLTRTTFLDSVAEFDYDDRDLAVEQRMPIGVTKHFQFNAHAQVVESVVDPGGLSLRSQLEYDLTGRLRRYVDPTGKATIWDRDVLGRATAIKPPDGTIWKYFIDTNARKTEEQTPSGNRVVHELVGAGSRRVRVTSFAAPGQENVAPQEFAFDGMGRLVQATTGADTVQRQYDSLGRLIEETARGQIVQFEYDDSTGSVDLVFPDGRRERTEHNLAGQPTRIVLITPGSLGGTSGDVLLEISYSTSGRAILLVYGNGVEGHLAHDDHDRVIRIEYRKGGVLLDSCCLRYDESGHRAVVQYLGAPARNLVHDFDGADRLVETRSGFPLAPLPDATAPAAQAADVAGARAAAALAPGVGFSLDNADTRSKVSALNGGAADENYVSTNDHRVTAVGARTISYNLDGTRTGDVRYTYELDALNRVRRVRDRSTNAVVAEMKYDALSRVAAGATDGQEFERWFAGSTRIHEVSNPATGATRQHSPHPLWPSPLCVVDAAGPAYIHQDEGWSTMCVTDATGAVLEHHRYDVFGASAAFAADGVTPLASLRTEPMWRGMPTLGTTTLFSTPQRLYDPEIGIFTSRDPLLYADSPSPYAYAAHNPVDFADPTGFAKSPLGNVRSGPRFDDSWERSHQEAMVLTTGEAHRAQDERMFNLDLPPSELPFDWPEFKIPYEVLYGLKQSIYKPIKAHWFDERPKYLDSKQNVQTVPWRPDRMDAAVAYAQIASLMIPAPRIAAAPGRANPFGFLSELEARNVALQEQVGQVATGLEPFRRVTIGGGTTEIAGRKVSVVMVTDQNAYELLQSGAVPLPEGVELLPRLQPWPKTLLPEQHMERLIVAHLEARGAQGGLVFTRGPRLLARGRMSGFACETCAPAWFLGEYPTWWHANANPANWEMGPGKYVWDPL
jgi:RHS repeat-associated protein